MCECEFNVITDEEIIDIDNAPIEDLLDFLETQLRVLNVDGIQLSMTVYFEDYLHPEMLADMVSNIFI